MEIPILLPKPYPLQLEFLRSKAKRKVFVAGRRVGKTTSLAILAVEAMLAGKRVLEVAPTSDQTDAFWNACKKYLSKAIASGIVYKNETERVLRLPRTPLSGSRGVSPILLEQLSLEEQDIPTMPQIRAKTAWDADTLRGDYADYLLFDEYSLMAPNAWTEVGAPMLLDNDGDAVFCFTPKRKNHAHSHYVRALADTSGRWAVFRFSSLKNPHLSETAMAEITQDMTEPEYRQEILAEFLDSEGQVFRNIAACMHAPATSYPEHHEGHRIVAGVDWAQVVDFTAISIGCADCRVELERDRFNRIRFSLQRARIKSLFDKWQPESILVEINSIGKPNFEELEDLGLPVEAFETTAQSKPPAVQNLALALERTSWQFQPDLLWQAELEAYEEKVTAHGRSVYSAPDGVHDDTVVARFLMLWKAKHAGGSAMMQAPIKGRPKHRPVVRRAVKRVRSRRKVTW